MPYGPQAAGGGYTPYPEQQAAMGGTPQSPDEERGAQRGQPQQQEEQQMTPEEAQRQIRDPLSYLAMVNDANKERFAMGMTSPDTLLRNAGRAISPQMAVDWSPSGGPRMPPQMPDPARNYGPRAMFNPIEADELSRMLEEYQLGGNPKSMWGF